ncbi:unnamed protein product [Polarella glacialis]|uniref:Apple domain-containing protein n=1 Tax=Polarella glacialis TaxID=89957 RepID=A0A813LYD3_POLGL|nr:unnamed protein product [Polarella glacialis]
MGLLGYGLINGATCHSDIAGDDTDEQEVVHIDMVHRCNAQRSQSGRCVAITALSVLSFIVACGVGAAALMPKLRPSKTSGLRPLNSLEMKAYEARWANNDRLPDWAKGNYAALVDPEDPGYAEALAEAPKPATTTAAPRMPIDYCGLVEKDIEYNGAAHTVWRNVLSPEVCCAKCQVLAACRTWVLDTVNHMCILKTLSPNATLSKISSTRSISGLPYRWDRPNSIFCFVVFRPQSYEQGLLAWQHKHLANIFACDEWAVYSSHRVEIIPDYLVSAVVDSDLKCQVGGEFGTALNTDIFFKVWDKVEQEGRYKYHTWTVKVDPDSVFFVQRLRVAVAFHNDTAEVGTYFNNCKFGLHGPIEVLSKKAVDAWRDGRQNCKQHFDKLCSGPCLWGEDMFIDQCLEKVLKAKRVDDWNLISEAHCASVDWTECRNGAITFHPFKDLESYKRCVENANAAPMRTLV